MGGTIARDFASALSTEPGYAPEATVLHWSVKRSSDDDGPRTSVTSSVSDGPIVVADTAQSRRTPRRGQTYPTSWSKTKPTFIIGDDSDSN